MLGLVSLRIHKGHGHAHYDVSASGCDLHDVCRPLLSRGETVLRSHPDAPCDGEQGIGPSFRLSWYQMIAASVRVPSACCVVT